MLDAASGVLALSPYKCDSRRYGRGGGVGRGLGVGAMRGVGVGLGVGVPVAVAVGVAVAVAVGVGVGVGVPPHVPPNCRSYSTGLLLLGLITTV